MKSLSLLFFGLLLVLSAACQKEEIDPSENSTSAASIREVKLSSTTAKGQSQEIEVTIVKPTPCHVVAEVNTTYSGTAVNYDFILEQASEACIQVIAEEVVPVSFAPQSSGLYTLNFLINGKLFETRKVTVTN